MKSNEQQIKLIPVAGSTQVKRAGYDTVTGTMEIEFYSGGRYRYFDVPISKYVGLLRAESKGSYHAENIRDSFKYEKCGDL